MKKFVIPIAGLIISIITSTISYSQEWMPVLRNELGDTIHYVWPIPDSTIDIKDEVIIKFKKNALHIDKLCYEYSSPYLIKSMTPEDIYDFYAYQKGQMMSQQFSVDSLIADPLLRDAIKSYGGIYLKRITAANPCTDTLSITRFGDTVPCANFLWMTLKLDNDTSVINSCVGLTVGFQHFLDIVEPNYVGELNAQPIDTYYNGLQYKQRSLHPSYTDVEGAWDYQVGLSNIKIGIIDNGIDYRHCDLGLLKLGLNRKVIDGFNYVDPVIGINNDCWHGTCVAGIIGALTNGSMPCTNTGIAGIAGGWLSFPVDVENDNFGCELIGLKVDIDSEESETDIAISKVLGAIYDASSEYQNEHIMKSSFGTHILNCSWAYYSNTFTNKYSLSMQNAFNFAYEQGVSIVASRGNNTQYDLEPPDYIQYPACFDPSWITSVGGHDSQIPSKIDFASYYGKYMDILAPSSYDHLIITTNVGGGIETMFGGTSAAAAHVSGAIALLRSDLLKPIHPANPDNVKLEPEDFENMLKAAAQDLNYDPENEDIYQKTDIGYDNITGWGQLKVGKLFQMMYQDDYILKHYTITYMHPPVDFFSGPPPDIDKLTVVKNGIRDDCEENEYRFKRRTITGSIELDDDWQIDEDNNLYVWGRNGRTTKGGLSFGNPLYLTSYTEVTSGELGNEWKVQGIVHNNSLTVITKTYQYELWDKDDDEFIQYLPEDENIEMYLTVFGKRKITSVEDQNVIKSKLILYPNPTTNKINIKTKIKKSCYPIIELYNSIGIVVYKEQSSKLISGELDTILDVSSLSVGIYTLRILNIDDVISKQIIIMR